MAYHRPLKDTAHIELLAGPGHNEMAAKYGISSITKRETYFQKINGYNVYETESYRELNGKKGLVYSTYVAIKTKVISILAITNRAISEDLAEFKKLLSHTTKVKAAVLVIKPQGVCLRCFPSCLDKQNDKWLASQRCGNKNKRCTIILSSV